MALVLCGATIVANTLEGVFSTWLGLRDETIALFGFGVDSFIEVVSAAGILHMIIRQSRRPDSESAPFERTALRITGTCFLLLTLGLWATAAIQFWQGHRPETTIWGAVIALLSLTTMWILYKKKLSVGTALHSPAILSDAHCTRVCIQMSGVLLSSSLLYEATGVGMLDSVGALGLGWLSLQEGREALEKARTGDLCCD